MGRKSQSTTKKIQKTLGDEVDTSDLQKCFSQMTGAVNPDLNIVLPKYDAIHTCINKIQECLIELKVDILDKYNIDENSNNDIRNFIKNLREIISNRKSNLEFGSEDYLAIKGNADINSMVITCSKLLPIAPQITKTWEEVDKKFFMRIQQTSYTPLEFAPTLDLKKIWIVDGDGNPEMVKMLHSVLKTLFNMTHIIYKTVTSPDVDISKLSAIIIGALGALKKQIPRCEKAFKKITDSVSLLENNFDTYYKDFVQSNDPTNIFTGFIGDVANTCDTDPHLIFQCRKIVNFYKKNMKMAPGMSSEKTKMFDSLMKNYSNLEKRMVSESDINKYEADDEKEDKMNDPESKEPEDSRTHKEKEEDLDDIMNFINNTKIK
jgi:hypothetical protein